MEVFYNLWTFAIEVHNTYFPQEATLDVAYSENELLVLGLFGSRLVNPASGQYWITLPSPLYCFLCYVTEM